MDLWAYKDGVHLDLIRPGKLVENGYYVISVYQVIAGLCQLCESG
jgi:hypothetical protein